MIVLYNIGIRFYYLLVFMASLRNEKAKKWIAGRKSALQQLKDQKGRSTRTIWFHCASVGEYEQALPLIELMKESYGQFQLLVTFFSPSGYEYARLKYPAQYITYLPLDTAVNMRQFVKEADPVAVFIIKYEFWYHLLKTLSDKNIPVFLISGIFRKQQLFFHPAGILHRKMLGFFTHLFVQDTGSADLLSTLKIKQVTVAGDTRFDRVISNKSVPFQDMQIQRFAGDQQVFIAGSVWNSDIPVLKAIVEALPAEWRILIAPHEPGHFQTDWIAEPFCFYTAQTSPPARIMVLDTIGLLSRLYRFADFVYVGGGFGKGIHNILEPAVYFKPVLIGKNYHKFKEAHDLLALGAALTVNSENAAILIKNTIFDEIKYLQIVNSLKSYIAANTNLSEKILVLVSTYLKA
ncbi:MAG: 3-deoxy-D-manno-octulosonic acid transferase [Chitinophagaceae bacterium]|nr:3-deoxy-D-manno-octulosonic acid transferase [Chitinophagaceae bacterium]